MKLELTRNEIALIIASTYHQYSAEDENSEYGKNVRADIKALHKKLSKYLTYFGLINTYLLGDSNAY